MSAYLADHFAYVSPRHDQIKLLAGRDDLRAVTRSLGRRSFFNDNVDPRPSPASGASLSQPPFTTRPLPASEV